jgi:hypothetical protein
MVKMKKKDWFAGPALIEEGRTLMEKGIQADPHGVILVSGSRKDSKGLKPIPHIIDVQFDLMVPLLLALIHTENRFLKPILEKELCLAVDAFKESLPRIGFGTLDQRPPFWNPIPGKEGFHGDGCGRNILLRYQQGQDSENHKCFIIHPVISNEELDGETNLT